MAASGILLLELVVQPFLNWCFGRHHGVCQRLEDFQDLCCPDQLSVGIPVLRRLFHSGLLMDKLQNRIFARCHKRVTHRQVGVALGELAFEETIPWGFQGSVKDTSSRVVAWNEQLAVDFLG